MDLLGNIYSITGGEVLMYQPWTAWPETGGAWHYYYGYWMKSWNGWGGQGQGEIDRYQPSTGDPNSPYVWVNVADALAPNGSTIFNAGFVTGVPGVQWFGAYYYWGPVEGTNFPGLLHWGNWEGTVVCGG
jgi:hypothetical protein